MYKDTNSIMTYNLYDTIYKYIQRNYLLDINYHYNDDIINNILHVILVYLYINSFDVLSLKTQYELLDYLKCLNIILMILFQLNIQWKYLEKYSKDILFLIRMEFHKSHMILNAIEI